MVIEKKILPEYYKAVLDRTKTFELRRDEDNIQAGDVLVLKEWDGEHYTGEALTRCVTYVLRDCPQYGLMDGFCVIGIQPIGWDEPWNMPTISMTQNGDNCTQITNVATLNMNL